MFCLLVVSVEEEGEGRTVHTARRLNDVGVVMVLKLLIEVFEVLAAGLSVVFEVVVGAVCYTLQFGPALGEAVLDVVAVLGVVGQLIRAMSAQPEILPPDAMPHVP